MIRKYDTRLLIILEGIFLLYITNTLFPKIKRLHFTFLIEQRETSKLINNNVFVTAESLLRGMHQRFPRNPFLSNPFEKNLGASKNLSLSIHNSLSRWRRGGWGGRLLVGPIRLNHQAARIGTELEVGEKKKKKKREEWKRLLGYTVARISL